MTSKDVARLRRELNLDFVHFARLVGVNVGTVYRWESGGPAPEGAALAVMVAFREALSGPPRKAHKVARLLHGTAEIGGLSYLLVKLLENAVKR